MSVQCETTARRAVGADMPFFERYLSVWVALCIVVGIALGRLFPPMFDALSRQGVCARALERGLWQLRCWNPREFATDAYRSVDLV